jgi:hypothetical protein
MLHVAMLHFPVLHALLLMLHMLHLAGGVLRLFLVLLVLCRGRQGCGQYKQQE